MGVEPTSPAADLATLPLSYPSGCPGWLAPGASRGKFASMLLGFTGSLAGWLPSRSRLSRWLFSNSRTWLILCLGTGALVLLDLSAEGGRRCTSLLSSSGGCRVWQPLLLSCTFRRASRLVDPALFHIFFFVALLLCFLVIVFCSGNAFD